MSVFVMQFSTSAKLQRERVVSLQTSTKRLV